MKAKKIMQLLEEFNKNGCKNLEFKLPNEEQWQQSAVSTKKQIAFNIDVDKYKYRIKKEKPTTKAVEKTNEDTSTGNCKMLLEDIASVLKQFDKDGSSDNLEYEFNGEYKPSFINRKGLESNIKRFGMVYRIKPGISDTNQLPLMPPIILKNGYKKVDASTNYPGNYYISTSMYFKTKEDAEEWLNFMKKFEVNM